MCSIFYPGEIFLRKRKLLSHDRSAHTSKHMCPTEQSTTGETPRARTRAKVVISCSTFCNVDHCYYAWPHTHEFGAVDVASEIASSGSSQIYRNNTLRHNALFSSCISFTKLTYDRRPSQAYGRTLTEMTSFPFPLWHFLICR